MGKLVGKRWLSEQRQRQQRSGSSSRETQGAPWEVSQKGRCRGGSGGVRSPGTSKPTNRFSITPSETGVQGGAPHPGETAVFRPHRKCAPPLGLAFFFGAAKAAPRCTTRALEWGALPADDTRLMHLRGRPRG